MIIKSIDQLCEIRDRAMAERSSYGVHILVCAGTNCTSGGCFEILSFFNEKLKEHKLENDVKVVKTGCFGLCANGPVVIVYPEGAFYSRLSIADAGEVFDEHILNGRIVKRLLYQDSMHDGIIEPLENTGFYRAQTRVALRNCGVIDPEDINEYFAFDGYQALGKVLREMSPAGVIEVLTASGLRGRGGAGFPTGIKWSYAANQPAGKKYVCCNADEGDPGAFMDRSVLEGDPHALIEAMAIAGYAIGSDQGYVYVRAEYPIAVERLTIAIDMAREAGLLGKDIFESGFNFDLEIRLGAGAFVCGEETALLTSIEGRRGEPKNRPPFPAERGLFGKPTIINNVETFVNIPRIILNGPEWLNSMGTDSSKGTKVFALGGNVTNIGLVEVPMGTPLRTIVEEIGGGIPDGRKFKAAQTGGPSGGCIPAEHLDVPIDYESLRSIGSMMGSGGLIVMDDSNCMVDIAKFFLGFTVDESCGKCSPCRIGTKRLYDIVDRISQGKGRTEDIDKLEDLSLHIKAASLCGLGQTAPNPVLSTLKYFRAEYGEHIINKRCPAGVCKDLLDYEILPDKCIGCTVCVKICPTGAISGTLKEAHAIDKTKCVKCGSCVEKCKFKAIIQR